MKNGYNASFEDEPVDGLPNQAMEKVGGASLSLQQKEYRKAQSLARRMEKLQTDYLKELHVTVTEPKWSEWTQTRLKNRIALREAIAKAEPTIQGENEIKNRKKVIIVNGKKFREDFGFNITKATKLRDQHSKRLEKVINTAWKIPAKPTFLLSKGPIDNPHPWTITNPPYSGQYSNYSWFKSDEPYYPTLSGYVNRITGQVGSYTRTKVNGADDWDKSYVWYRTGLRFWYKMPATGIFELYLKLQAIYSNYRGDTDDEWGFSDCCVKQYSRPYVRVIYPSVGNIRYGNNIFYYHTHTDDNYWNRNVIGSGDYRWTYVLSDAAYPTNQWLYVEAGIEDYNYFWCNDVSVDSIMNMKWFVPSIYIRPKT